MAESVAAEAIEGILKDSASFFALVERAKARASTREELEEMFTAWAAENVPAEAPPAPPAAPPPPQPQKDEEDEEALLLSPPSAEPLNGAPMDPLLAELLNEPSAAPAGSFHKTTSFAVRVHEMRSNTLMDDPVTAQKRARSIRNSNTELLKGDYKTDQRLYTIAQRLCVLEYGGPALPHFYAFEEKLSHSQRVELLRLLCTYLGEFELIFKAMDNDLRHEREMNAQLRHEVAQLRT